MRSPRLRQCLLDDLVRRAGLHSDEMTRLAELGARPANDKIAKQQEPDRLGERSKRRRGERDDTGENGMLNSPAYCAASRAR